jgi:hypothetical protein
MIYGWTQDAQTKRWHVTVKRGDEIVYLCQAIDERCARDTAAALNEWRR